MYLRFRATLYSCWQLDPFYSNEAMKIHRAVGIRKRGVFTLWSQQRHRHQSAVPNIMDLSLCPFLQKNHILGFNNSLRHWKQFPDFHVAQLPSALYTVLYSK